MPEPVKAPRSRTGCNTCKSKKVKCDERKPVCRKCDRLNRQCIWETSERPPLADSRRGEGPWKSRENKVLRSIAPRDASEEIKDMKVGRSADIEQPPQSNSWQSSSSLDNHYNPGSNVDRDNNDEPQEPLDSTYLYNASMYHLDMPDNALEFTDNDANMPNFLWGMPDACMLDDMYLPFGDLLEVPLISSELQDHQNELGSGMVQHFRTISTSTNDQYPIPYSLLMSPSPQAGLDSYNTSHPSSIVLNKEDHYALHRYQATLPLSFATKAHTWSTYKIFLNLSSGDDMLMHFLLAASLKYLAASGEEALNGDTNLSARKHYEKGAELLLLSLAKQDTLTQQALDRHISVMTSFWFLYIYRASQRNINAQAVSQLSKMAADYVQHHQLDKLCATVSSSASAHNGNDNRKSRSTLSRVIVWLFYSDVSFSFRNCGGHLAHYLSHNRHQMEKVYDASRAVFLYNWGDKYPIEQVLDDNDNSSILEMLYKVHMLYQDINEIALDPHLAKEREGVIERELLELEEKYSFIFKLANSPLEPRPRQMENADYVVGHFYAIRIYFFRCTTTASTIPSSSNNSSIRPPEVEEALNNLFEIVHRTFKNEKPTHWRFQWPLLIAGAETSNSILKSWILDHMWDDALKEALRKIMKRQDLRSGWERLDMCGVRELCCGMQVENVEVGGKLEGVGGSGIVV